MSDLNRRVLEVFELVVRVYMQTGSPTGSDILKQHLSETVSSATIRNILALLQKKGFVRAPHISAGRLPTDQGLRFFVEKVVGPKDILSVEEEEYIQQSCRSVGYNLAKSVRRATEILAELSGCSGLMLIPAEDRVIEHIECVPLKKQKVLLVIVGDKGYVDTQMMWLPPFVSFDFLHNTIKIFNSRFAGQTLQEIVSQIQIGCLPQKKSARTLVQRIILNALAGWLETERKMKLETSRMLNVLQEGQDPTESALDILKKQEALEDLMASVAPGSVNTYIGASGWKFTQDNVSFVLAGVPCMRTQSKLGVLGVVGHKRMDYGKVIPLVRYVVQVMADILNENDEGDLYVYD